MALREVGRFGAISGRVAEPRTSNTTRSVAGRVLVMEAPLEVMPGEIEGVSVVRA
jgi:hypothetical protein